MIGSTLAHFKITAKLGEGGMGEVYLAEDTKLGREVAIKVLPEAVASDPDRLARFEREAKVLASLNHPNIAAIYQVEQDGDTHFLVMELVGGEDLKERLDRGSLPVEDVLPIALQVAEALEAAHERGVVHRDLKPANVKVTPENQVKVLDFGLAKALDPQEASSSSSDLSYSPLSLSPTLTQQMTGAGVILGTAAYMSPEQARGRAINKRSDIWSYGVVLYELLTGKNLFGGETLSDTMAEVLKADVDLDQLPDETSDVMVALMKRCLDRNPETRLRDIGEARILLTRLRDGELADARERSAGATSTARGVALTGWIVAGLALLGLAASILTRPDPPARGELPLRKSIIPLSKQDISAQRFFDPSISPDGRYLAYVSQNQLWIRDLTTTEARPLTGTEGASNPFWSPDSKWIAFGREQSVLKVPLEGGSPSHIALIKGGSITSTGSGGTWTLDDRVILGTGNSGLLGVSSQGGEVKTVLTQTEGETDFHEVATLPESKGILVIIHNEENYGNLDVWTPDGERRTVLRLKDGLNAIAYSPSGHIVFERDGDSRGVWAVPFSLQNLEITGEPFLVALEGREPSVSADGTLVYVDGASDKKGQMVWVDRKGEILQEIGPVETVGRPFPELTTDERWIFHAADTTDGRELFRYDLTTGNRQRLTFDELSQDLAVLHPNGQDLLFYESDKFMTMALSLSDPDGSRELLRGIMAQFNRDGSKIVFSRNKPETFDWDLIARDYSGGDDSEIVIVDAPGIEWWPQISPDDQYLLYTSDESGDYEVYITSFPEGSGRWQVSTEGGEWPRWRADGREIFYTTRDAIMAVDVQLEGGLSLGPPRELFQRPHIDWSSDWADSFDVSTDGQRFVLFRPVLEDEAKEPGMVIVQNWFAEFSN